MQQRVFPTTLAALSLSALAPAQESRALYDAPLVMLDPQHRIEQLVEMDGTPGPEALTWWWTSSTRDDFYVRCMDYDDHNGFTTHWEMTLNNNGGANGPVSLTAAALDGPETDDLIVTNRRWMRLFLNGRLGAPTQIQQEVEPQDFVGVFPVDLDGNGEQDIVTVAANGKGIVWVNGGAAASYAFTAQPLTKNLGVITSRIRMAELTGDGTPDLFYVRNDAIVIQPLGSGFSFPTEITYPLAAPYVMPIPVVGDIDGDADEDGVVFSCDPATMTGIYTVLRRTSPTTLVQESLAIGGPATDFVDLDGDGDLDGACCSGGGGGISSQYGWQNSGGSTFELCHNDGTGNFTPSFKIRGLGAEKLAAATDIDSDGDVDLIAGRVIYYAPEPITGPGETGLVSGEHWTRVARDWDEDGDPDLCVGYESFKRANGYGGFESVAPELKPLTVNGLAFKGPGYAGDYDGDGDDDLLVAKYKDGTFRKMRVLVNTGGGKLVDGWDASGPGVSFSKTGEDYLDPRGGWAVDYDKDGDVDLFTWEPDANYPDTSLWINDGTGFYTESTSFSQGDMPQGIGEFNGDGIRDLLVTNYVGYAYVRLGDGSGGFSFSKTVMSGAEFDGELGSLGVADFDDDGDRDIVGANVEYNGGYRAYVFVNDGQANFTAVDLGFGGPFHSGQPDARVVVTDANGDGWSDVIVSNLDSARSAAAVVLRNPNGQLFQEHFEQVMRPYHDKDLDGDGDIDLIDGSFVNDPLVDDRLILNRTVETTGWRMQMDNGVAGEAGFTPTLGAQLFGGYEFRDSIKYKLTGAAPGVTGRMIIDELGTTAAPYNVTPNQWSALSEASDVSKNFTRVIEFVTTGSPGDPAGSGKWDTRHVIKSWHAGRTFIYRVEIDDPAAPNGLAQSNELYVRFAD